MRTWTTFLSAAIVLSSVSVMAASSSHNDDAVSLALMWDRGTLKETTLKTIQRELSAIDQLGIPELADIHQRRGKISIGLKLKPSAAKVIKAKLSPVVDLASGAEVKKVYVKALDQMNARLHAETVFVEQDDTDTAITIELSYEVSEKIDLVATQKAYLATNLVSDVAISGGYTRGGGIGANRIPLQRLQDDGKKATYIFWQAIGDCMAGCAGRTFQIEVDKTQPLFTASVVKADALQPTP